MELIRIYPKSTIQSNVSEVKIKITPKKYKHAKINALYAMKVYFSNLLLNELCWSKGDRIAVYKESDNDNYIFKIADDNKGFILQSSRDINSIQFITNKFIEKYISPTIVNFTIIDNSLKITL